MTAQNPVESLSARARRIHAAVDQKFGPFVTGRVNPGAAERDLAGEPVPRELFQEAARIGLLGLSLSERVGGGGVEISEWGFIMERLGYLCRDSSWPLALGLFAAVAATLERSGSASVVDRYVRPMARGDCLGAFAYSEGADPFSFASTAKQDGDHWVLNGRKELITGGVHADVFMTYVRGEHDDLAVFLVERTDAGVEVRPVETLGVRSAGLAEVVLRDVRVGPERQLVPVDGLTHVQLFLNQRRVVLGSSMVGRMQGALEACVAELGRTIRYGRPLTEMQNVQAAIGRMHASIEASRAMLYGALDTIRAGETHAIWDPLLSATKYFITEQAIALGKATLHLMGGRGYTRDLPFERYLRDALALIPGAGAQDVLEVNLGTHVISSLERRERTTS